MIDENCGKLRSRINGELWIVYIPVLHRPSIFLYFADSVVLCLWRTYCLARGEAGESSGCNIATNGNGRQTVSWISFASTCFNFAPFTLTLTVTTAHDCTTDALTFDQLTTDYNFPQICRLLDAGALPLISNKRLARFSDFRHSSFI